MSRIRSIHPGLWTDEAFVTLSPFARLLILGIWNESDDKGTFPWSPLQMKMRVLPADNVDAPALMEELQSAGLIKRYEVSGKSFGAVRNFCKFQRPKKPNDVHPITDEMRNYVAMTAGHSSSGGEAVPNQFPTEEEKSPQMEEGGGNSSSDASASGADAADDPMPDPLKVMFEAGLRLFALEGKPESKARPLLGKWRQQYGPEAVITALGAAQREGAIDLVPFMERCLKNGQHRRVQSSGEPSNPIFAAGARRQAERASVDLSWHE